MTPHAPKVSAGVCIVHPGDSTKVLSITRNLSPCSGWALPGGQGEPGEYAWETAVRETFEETGVRVMFKDLVKGYRAILHDTDTTFFLVRPTVVPKFRRINSEGVVGWKSPEEVLEYGPYAEYNRAMFQHFGLMKRIP